MIQLVRILLLVIGLCVTTMWAEAQSTLVFGDSTTKQDPTRRYSITGRVVHAEDKTPIAGAALFVDGLKYGNTSDAAGRYFILIPPGKYRLSIRHLGMTPLSRRIAIFGNGVFNIELTEKPEALEEVVIRARQIDDNIKEVTSGVTKLNITEIKRLPAFMGEVDVIKSIQLLPGVNSVGEGSSGFNVRGGRIDQNLILMDGGQIFNSSHALGLLSNFNPDVVEEFTLYKGNVPAQFGGRASSVLDVRTRSGNFDAWKVKGGIGLITSRAAVEGPIIKDKTSLLVGTRFSYSDWVLRSVGETNVRRSAASFYDINGSIAHKFSRKNSIYASFYQGNDYFRFSNEFGYEYTTRLANFKWKNIINDHWSTSLIAVSGDYESKLFDYAPASARSLTNGIRYYQVKESALYTIGDIHALTFGAEVNLYDGKPEISNPFGTFSTTQKQRVEKDRGQEAGIFFNEEYTLSTALSLTAGLRYSIFRNIGADTVYVYQSGLPRSTSTITDTLFYKNNSTIRQYDGWEPRLSLRLTLSQSASVKLSYNRMMQYIQLISNGTAPTPVDVWQVCNPFIRPQTANNYTIGYFRNVNENMFELSGEIFYKTTDNLTEYKDFSHLLLNRHLETELIQGKGKSYGLELYVKKNSGGWTGWLSYTYLRSFIMVNGSFPEEQINRGNWYPTNYDKPHTVNLTANHKLGKNARFAANFTYSTGRPTSALEASYRAGSVAIPIYSDRNQYRIPDYWRLDISITLNNVFKKLDDNLTFSVYNLLARHNAYSIYYQQPQGNPVPQGYKLSILGSALPSITYNFSF